MCWGRCKLSEDGDITSLVATDVVRDVLWRHRPLKTAALRETSQKLVTLDLSSSVYRLHSPASIQPIKRLETNRTTRLKISDDKKKKKSLTVRFAPSVTHVLWWWWTRGAGRRGSVQSKHYKGLNPEIKFIWRTTQFDLWLIMSPPRCEGLESEQQWTEPRRDGQYGEAGRGSRGSWEWEGGICSVVWVRRPRSGHKLLSHMLSCWLYNGSETAAGWASREAALMLCWSCRDRQAPVYLQFSSRH